MNQPSHTPSFAGILARQDWQNPTIIHLNRLEAHPAFSSWGSVEEARDAGPVRGVSLLTAPGSFITPPARKR